jgi:hypothetical protein
MRRVFTSGISADTMLTDGVSIAASCSKETTAKLLKSGLQDFETHRLSIF